MSVNQHVPITITLCAFLPIGAMYAEERVCAHASGGRDTHIRWSQEKKLELRGKIYYDSDVHWFAGGGWRTQGKYYRTAGIDDNGAHHIYLNEIRYEFFPKEGQEGVLHRHISKRLTDPKDEARVKQRKYNYPLPPVTPAANPILTTPNPGITYSHNIATCSSPKKALTMASDLSIWDIFRLTILDAIKSKKK